MAKITVDLGDGKKASVEVSTLAQEDTLQRLLKIMDVAGKSNTINTQTSQRAINDLGDAASASVDALEELPTSFEDASDAVEEAAGNMRDASAKFKKDLSSSMFTNTKSLFSGMSSPMEFLKDSTKSVGDGFKGLLTASSKSGGAMAGLSGNMLKMLGPIGIAASLLSAALGFLIGRAKKNIEMYDNAIKAGATFTGGLEEFRETVTNSSLNLDDFNSVLTKHSADFAFFGGTVANGAVKFAAVSKEMGKFGVSFRNLGFSAEEMGGLQADYMAQLAASGELTGKRAKSDAVVAAGAMDYAKNLKTMSAITGESIEQAKAEQQEKMKDFRVMLAARKYAQERGIDEVAARQLITNDMAKYPHMQEAVISGYANNGQMIGEAANRQAMLFNGAATSFQAGFQAADGAIRSGAKDVSTISTASALAQAKYADKVAADYAIGSTAYIAGMNEANGATSEWGQAAATGIPLIEKSAQRIGAAGEAAAKTTALEKDRASLTAQQNVAADLAYKVQKKATDFADMVAIKGMAGLQKALIKLAVVIFDIIPGMGEMPEELQAMNDAMNAETEARHAKVIADKRAAAAKSANDTVAAMDDKKKAELATKSAELLNSGIAANIIKGKVGEKKSDETDDAYAARKKEAVLKAYTGGPQEGMMAGQIEMQVRSQMSALKKTDAGKGLNDEQLFALVQQEFQRNGMVLESMNKVSKAVAAPQPAQQQATPPSAAGTEVPKAANGGILSGARSGFDAILHGTEAVVPLPDNKTIPVSLNLPDSVADIMGGASAGSSNLGPTMSQVRDLLQMQNALLSELIDHTKTGVSVQKNIRDLNF